MAEEESCGHWNVRNWKVMNWSLKMCGVISWSVIHRTVINWRVRILNGKNLKCDDVKSETLKCETLARIKLNCHGLTKGTLNNETINNDNFVFWNMKEHTHWISWLRSVIELMSDALKRVRMRFEKSINGKVQWTELQCGNIRHWNTIDWSVLYWSVENGSLIKTKCVTLGTAIKSTVITWSVTKNEVQQV